MAQKIPENVVICIDTSRSMHRTDFKPDRLKSCINALKKLVELRLESDPSSSFAIVTFLDKPTKILDFTNIVHDLHSTLDSLTISGRSPIGDAIATSIKVAIGELRKIGAKIPKILLVSDGNYTQSNTDPIKMAKLAKGLNIKIDTFRLGDSGSINVLKNISETSGGRSHYTNSPDSLLDAASSFAAENIKSYNQDSKLQIQNPSFLRKIAADPLSVQDLTEDQEQRIKQLRGEADYKKCSICFSETDPNSKGSFFLTGRYCPNCQTPFHIHCLAGWAASQSEFDAKKSETCRCPHCFYLLRIPSEVAQMRKLHSLSVLSQRRDSPKEPGTYEATIVNISILGEEALYKSCIICNYIFDPGQDVVECGNLDCGTLYHKECFSKLTNNQCKNCGGKLDLI
ncbi:MAG: VWA domain-containing protein [Promethearchaeota archaeon]